VNLSESLSSAEDSPAHGDKQGLFLIVIATSWRACVPPPVAIGTPSDAGNGLLARQAPVLWHWYMLLAQVEEAFKTLKSNLSLRPIFHQVEQRVGAHILGCCLHVALRMKL
jgi:hypothetical protein